MLIFAGTEVLVLAPFIFDVAALVDTFGLLFVLAAGGASVRQSLGRLWWPVREGAKGILVAFRGVDAIADFGSKLSAKWQQQYLVVDVFAARMVLGLCVLFFSALAFNVLVSAYV